MRALTITAPGKLTLMGEYAVTQIGYPAVVTAIDRGVTIHLRPSSSYRITFSGIRPVEVKAPSSERLLKMLKNHRKFAPIVHILSFLREYLREENHILPGFSACFHSQLHDVSGKNMAWVPAPHWR